MLPNCSKSEEFCVPRSSEAPGEYSVLHSSCPNKNARKEGASKKIKWVDEDGKTSHHEVKARRISDNVDAHEAISVDSLPREIPYCKQGSLTAKELANQERDSEENKTSAEMESSLLGRGSVIYSAKSSTLHTISSTPRNDTQTLEKNPAPAVSVEDIVCKLLPSIKDHACPQNIEFLQCILSSMQKRELDDGTGNIRSFIRCLHTSLKVLHHANPEENTRHPRTVKLSDEYVASGPGKVELCEGAQVFLQSEVLKAILLDCNRKDWKKLTYRLLLEFYGQDLAWLSALRKRHSQGIHYNVYKGVYALASQHFGGDIDPQEFNDFINKRASNMKKWKMTVPIDTLETKEKLAVPEPVSVSKKQALHLSTVHITTPLSSQPVHGSVPLNVGSDTPPPTVRISSSTDSIEPCETENSGKSIVDTSVDTETPTHSKPSSLPFGKPAVSFYQPGVGNEPHQPNRPSSSTPANDPNLHTSGQFPLNLPHSHPTFYSYYPLNYYPTFNSYPPQGYATFNPGLCPVYPAPFYGFNNGY